MNTLHNIGQSLKAIRKEKGIKQKELASTLNVNADRLCKAEAGAVAVSLRFLFAWCDALGVRIDFKVKR